MKLSDSIRTVLAGGLPALLDDPTQRTAQGDTRPESTAPKGSIVDVEPFALVNPNTGRINIMPMVIGIGFVLATFALINSVRRG